MQRTAVDDAELLVVALPLPGHRAVFSLQEGDREVGHLGGEQGIICKETDPEEEEEDADAEDMPSIVGGEAKRLLICYNPIS